jgi:uncharacterized membrane protein YfcA
MEFVIIGAVAFVASGLTLFSGFGLGTVLLPAFALFFPLDVAVAMTAVVHLLNNLFKLALLGRNADRRALVAFGGPALLASFLGAYLLVWLADLEPLLSWTAVGGTHDITPVKLVVALLILGFALLELSPKADRLAFGPRWLPVGGAVSGFFGGLSGHQGALRSAFLIRAGLDKQAFIATGVVIACVVDLARVAVYSAHFTAEGLGENAAVLATAVVAGFAGALLGVRMIEKVTLKTVRVLVSLMLGAIALLLGSGMI